MPKNVNIVCFGNKFTVFCISCSLSIYLLQYLYLKTVGFNKSYRGELNAKRRRTVRGTTHKHSLRVFFLYYEGRSEESNR